MAVVVYAVLINMMLHPTAYGVIPLTANYAEETVESVQIVKYYCASESRLPIPEALSVFQPVAPHETTDYALIEDVVATLLAPGETDDVAPELETVTLPLAAAQFLAHFEGRKDPAKYVEATGMIGPDPLVCFSIRKQEEAKEEATVELPLIIELLNNVHPDAASQLAPRDEAILRFLTGKEIDYSEICQQIDRTCEERYRTVMALQKQVGMIERASNALNVAFEASESHFASICAGGIASDVAVLTELEKKKQNLRTDGPAFAAFVIGHVESYAQKHAYVKPFLRMVARKFHAILMEHFPLSGMSESEQQQRIDRLFLARKTRLLASLESTGIDPCVERIIKSKEIFSNAQTAALRACLFENPIESAAQLVLSLFVVEDLFVCEFGCPPEANQLMPLLANLFILSPIPTPLSFGRWLSQFFQPLMEAKKEWFSDESLRPLEHYFRFNEWMVDMLDTMSQSESLDSIRS
jgi:hypothetical protein